MIIQIEDYNGNRIGAFRIVENDIDGEDKITDMIGDISHADTEFDDLFNTNENKFRIQLGVINDWRSKK